MDTLAELRELIESAMRRGETSDGIALGSGVSDETLRNIRHGRTSSLRAHTRDRLLAYLRPKIGDSAPQHAEHVTHPGASIGGSARITVTATGNISGGFLSEDERRGYLRRTLEQAAQAIRDAQTALDTPVTAPETAALYEAGLDLADPKHLQAASPPRPARTRT